MFIVHLFITSGVHISYSNKDIDINENIYIKNNNTDLMHTDIHKHRDTDIPVYVFMGLNKIHTHYQM